MTAQQLLNTTNVFEYELGCFALEHNDENIYINIAVSNDVVPGTLPSGRYSIYYNEKRNLNDLEYRRMSSFPSDFNFCNSKVRYVCGMSVPP